MVRHRIALMADERQRILEQYEPAFCKISAAEVKLAGVQTTLDASKTEEGRGDHILAQENIVSSLGDESDNEQMDFATMAKVLMSIPIVESQAMAIGSVRTAEKVKLPSSDIQSSTKQRRLFYAGSSSLASGRERLPPIVVDLPSEISINESVPQNEFARIGIDASSQLCAAIYDFYASGCARVRV